MESKHICVLWSICDNIPMETQKIKERTSKEQMVNIKDREKAVQIMNEEKRDPHLPKITLNSLKFFLCNGSALSVPADKHGGYRGPVWTVHGLVQSLPYISMFVSFNVFFTENQGRLLYTVLLIDPWVNRTGQHV